MTDFCDWIDGPILEIGLEIALSFNYTSDFPIHNLSRYDRFIRVNVKAAFPMRISGI